MEDKKVLIQVFVAKDSFRLSKDMERFLANPVIEYIDSKIVFYMDEQPGIGRNGSHYTAFVFYKKI